jgi:hypothetical protein
MKYVEKKSEFWTNGIVNENVDTRRYQKIDKQKNIFSEGLLKVLLQNTHKKKKKYEGTRRILLFLHKKRAKTKTEK